MRVDHPMRERFDKMLKATGLSAEEAVEIACMSWTCKEELRQARMPRVWTRDNLEELRALAQSGTLSFEDPNDGSGDAYIREHSHPFYGLIIVRPGELLNEVWNEPR